MAVFLLPFLIPLMGKHSASGRARKEDPGSVESLVRRGGPLSMGPPSKRPELREMTGCRYQRLYFGTSTLLRAGDGPAGPGKSATPLALEHGRKASRLPHRATEKQQTGSVGYPLGTPPPLPIFPRHVRRQSGREGFALATPGSNCWCGSHGGRLAGKPY